MELTVPEKISARAEELGVSPKLAVEIARAENRHFVPDLKNPSPQSTASGIYQFLNSTFRDFCIKKYELTDTMDDKNNVGIQIECALRILKDGGEKHWDASRSVWSKNI